MRRALLTLLLICTARLAVYAQTPHLGLVPAVQDRLNAPLYATSVPDGTGRMFILEQGGRILVKSKNSTSVSLFLDLTSKVLSGGERGLLGIAFHPDFAQNRRFFVDYTRRGDGTIILAEYRSSTTNPNIADPDELVVLTIPHPNSEHHGGCLQFGPDGMLYISTGDGGPQKDPQNHAQDLNTLWGKILRIDVDQGSGPNVRYAIPPDNPFVGSNLGREEIYAFGFRNPWRFSFDSVTGELYVGDVGQDTNEEVDVVEAGGNYGWRVVEGTYCTGFSPTPCSTPDFILPITEYVHTGRGGRCSITGGYVYRGSQETLPLGAYVFADYCTGEIFMIYGREVQLLLDSPLQITSFGEDEAGELYAVGGSVYRLTNSGDPFTPTVPFEFEQENTGVSITTDGTSDSVSIRHAEVQSNGGGDGTAALAFIDFRQGGILVSEAAVPATALIQDGRISVETGNDINTGIAIANPDMNQPVILSYTFTDSGGNDLEEYFLVIGAGGQISGFLDGPMFGGPSLFSGSLTLHSSVPVAIIALRGFVNERGEFLTTTLPVADLSARLTGQVLMPHFASGKGWTTRIPLVNPTDVTITGTIQFLSPNGDPEPVRLGGPSVSETVYTIPPRSSRIVVASDDDATLRVGSVRVIPDAETATPIVGAIYLYSTGGITVSATGVASGSAAKGFRMYAESSRTGTAIQTGIAIANPSNEETFVDLKLIPFDNANAETVTTVTIPANGQTVAFLDELFAGEDVSMPSQAVLQLSSGSPVTAMCVRTRYNERGDFLLSTAPPIEDEANSTGESFIPHIVDGGGYTTEIVLFSTDSAGSDSGDIHFFNQDGEPVTPSFQTDP